MSIAIHSTMPALIADVKAVGKDHKNQGQGYAYRSIDDLMAALHPLLTKHKVTVVPRFSEHQLVELQKGVRVTIKLELAWVAEDGSLVETVHYGEGIDFGDKATNKAMAGALKYAILQTLMVPTEELKDSEADSRVDKAAEAGETKPDWVKRFNSCRAKSSLEIAKRDAQVYFVGRADDDPEKVAALAAYQRKADQLG